MTSIDDFDLPTQPEALRMFRTWRQVAPPDHAIALLIRDLRRVRAVGGGGQPVPAILGTGAWFATMLCSLPPGLPGSVLAAFAYRPPMALGSARRLPGPHEMVVWLTSGDDYPTAAPPWRRSTDWRITIELHQMTEGQLGDGFVAPIVSA